MRREICQILFLLIISSVGRAQHRPLDSLRHLVKLSNADSGRVDLWLQMADVYQNISFDSTYHYAKMAMALSEKSQYVHGQAESMLMIGVAAWRRGDYEEGIARCQQAAVMAASNHFHKIHAMALINIGTIQNYQAQYSQALVTYQEALLLNEMLQDQAIFAQLYLNIGGIHYNHKDYDQALEYWNQALEINLKLGRRGSAGSCMNNIALVLAIKKDIRRSMKYYHQSISMYNEDDVCPKVYPYENIGSLFIDLENYDSAAYYYNLSLLGAQQCQNPILESASMAGLAEVSMAKGQYREALKYFEVALQIGERIGTTREVQLIALSLSELHERLGHLQQALDYYKKYTAIGDSLFGANNIAEVGRLQSKYAIEKQQREFEIKQERIAFENEKKLERQELIKNGFVFGLLIAVGIALIIYRNYKIKINANRQLTELNKAIHKQQEELIQQAQELKVLNFSLNELNENLENRIQERTKELEEKNEELESKNIKLGEYAYYNAHQLRSPVADILGLTALFDKKDISLEEAREIIENLKKMAQKLDIVVKEINEVLEDQKWLKHK